MDYYGVREKNKETQKDSEEEEVCCCQFLSVLIFKILIFLLKIKSKDRLL